MLNLKKLVPLQRRIPTITKHFATTQTLNMPLVDPVTTGAGGDKTQEWQSKLVGKKIGESSDATVCVYLAGCSSFVLAWSSWMDTLVTEQKTFAKTELPKEHRVIAPGTMVTKDFKPDR